MVLDVDTGGVPDHSRVMICEVKPAKPNTAGPALIQFRETVSRGSLTTPCRWVIASLLFIAASVVAADNDHWDDQFGAPGVDQLVMTIATNGNYVYVGGGFGIAGSEVTQGIARWDGTNWSSIGGISGSIPLVYSILAHGSDIYAAGYFTNAGNVATRSIARWNGQSWSALGVGVNGLAVCMAFLGNDLYVGGILYFRKFQVWRLNY